MFNSQQGFNTQESKHELSQDINRGLALLVLIAVSTVGSSWLFSLPVYFDVKIAAQISPLLFSVILLFAVTRLQQVYLYKIAAPLSYIALFSSWSYVIYLNTMIKPETINDLVSAQYLGFSNSMYILGLCLLTLWIGRYFKYAIYLSLISITSFIVLMFIFSNIDINFLLALFLLLGSCVVITAISFKSTALQIVPAYESITQPLDEDLLLPSELEEEDIKPELDINTLPLNEASVTHDWELILRELHGELRNTIDVDQLFKRMLVFLHGAMEYNAAAVGMLQDKSIKKIATYGDDEYLHTHSLNWTNQRVKQLFSSRESILSNQSHLSGATDEIEEQMHRLDIPVLSNQKVVGLVTLFRETLRFDTHDVKLASSIVFHSMVALRQARLQDEVKRLSSETSAPKLTLYSREQFVQKVKPVFEKLGKPRECSLFILEVDNLDTTIDTQGREAGSILLKAVSRSIVSKLRDNDLIGRYGNDGFVVLLDETNLIHAKSLAEEIRIKISNLKIKHQDFVITTTASIGLTIVSDPDEDLPSLMRKADMGLFVAKENGSNTTKVSL